MSDYQALALLLFIEEYFAKFIQHLEGQGHENPEAMAEQIAHDLKDIAQ